MAITTVKIHPMRYPNFVHLVVPNVPGQAQGDVALDVIDAFPTEEAAAAFWDEAKEGWLKHVAARRASGKNPSEVQK